MNPDDTTQTDQPFEVVPDEVRQRLATVGLALAITPHKSVRRGGIWGAISGEETPSGPTVTDALKIARFAVDDYRGIEGVDQADEPVGVTAEELLQHFTRQES